jgi:purine-binding chemotaxis protein CheW
MNTFNEPSQYLVFTLGKEQYALHISNVREVLESAHLTRLPESKQYLKGVINLRGSVVPVMDLALRLGIDGTHEQTDANIIVLEHEIEGVLQLLGALADSVQAVVEVDDSSIEEAPHIGGMSATKLLAGVAKHGEDFYIILDGESFFADEPEMLGKPETVAQPSREETAGGFL